MAILCRHCLRNIAFYKTGRQDGGPILKSEFWANVNGNFMDICVLEWCKLFGEEKGKHYWKNVISEPDVFFKDLLKDTNTTENGLKACKKEFRKYRDKFVAHLDSDRTMHIPHLGLAQKSTLYLYDYLLANEDDGEYFYGFPRNASKLYQHYLEMGESVYRKHKRC